MGSGGIVPFILNLGARWGEKSVSGPTRFIFSGIRMGNRKRFLGCTVLRDVTIATELSRPRPRPSLLYYLGICDQKLQWNHDVVKVEALIKETQ